jgi:hypothetical protein
MAPAVHFGGFDAEPRWRTPGLATLPEVKDSGTERMVAAMAELSWGFAAPGDVVIPSVDPALAPFAGPGGGDARGGMPSPYAVVPGIHEEAARLGLADGLPDVEVVRRVNSKLYSNQLVVDLGLPGAGRAVASAAELAEAVRAILPDGPALIKDPYGVSGRGSVTVGDDRLCARLVGHVQRQEEAGAQVALLVQPVLARAADFSCHFEVAPAGMRVRGVQQMDNEGMSFRSVRSPDPALLERLERAGQWRIMAEVAAALRAEGYVGPVCVDGMVLDDGRVVPLLEINARKSMGLLHDGLRARFDLNGPSELCVWSLTLHRAVELGALVRFDGARGLLPLAAGPLDANLGDLPRRGVARGRLYALLAWDDRLPRVRLLADAEAVLAQEGADIRRGPR